MSLKDLLISDIYTFLDTSEFAVEATFKGATINVIFDDEFEGVNLQTGNVESSAPQAYCKSTDVSNAVHGDTLTIGEVIYKIIGIQADGTGISILILSKD